MVVVDRDPLTCDVGALPATRVLRTVLGGRTVYDAGALRAAAAARSSAADLAPRTHSRFVRISVVRPLLARIVLAVAASVVTVAFVEGVLRILWRPQVASAWLLGTEKRVLDANLIFINPRHSEASFYRRDPELPTVLTLGDSFTEGFPVPPSRNYPSCLRRMLARAGRPMNVINLGMGDSGPDQQLLLFRTHALAHVQPDVVIWQLYENDTWDNITRPVYTIDEGRLEPIPAAENWLYKRQLFYDATPLPPSVKRYSYIYRYMLKSAEFWAKAQVPEAYANAPERWAREKLRLEIAEMERLAKEGGFHVYYVVVPPQAMDLTGTRGDHSTRVESLKVSHPKLRAMFASQRGYIDLDFQRGTKPTWLRLYAGGRRDPNGLGGRHLNEPGYRLMARRVARRILADFDTGIAVTRVSYP
jgi:lysophospholipase L1-like esterase